MLRRNSSFISPIESWGVGNSAAKEVLINERALEYDVSKYIGLMPFLWILVEDKPGPESARKIIESNSIALLSNLNGCPDRPSPAWLGRDCSNCNVIASGLWNSEHVSDPFVPNFMELFEEKIKITQDFYRNQG
jgi:hypothetical protein